MGSPIMGIHLFLHMWTLLLVNAKQHCFPDHHSLFSSEDCESTHCQTTLCRKLPLTLLLKTRDTCPRFKHPKWKRDTDEKEPNKINSQELESVVYQNKLVVIGKGSSAILYLCNFKAIGKLVVAKYFKPSISLTDIQAEARIARELNCTGIFPIYYGLIYHKGVATNGYLMEYLGSTDLKVITLETVLDDCATFRHSIISILQKIAEKLKLLHNRGFFHGDVQASNIILHGNELSVRLIDFGQVSRYDIPYSYILSKKTIKLLQDNYKYLAPEILDGSYFTLDSDVYSFGYLVKRIYLTCQLRNTAISLLYDSCLMVDPNKRPTMTEIFNSIILLN